MALRRLEIEESRHIATYGEQLKALGDEGSIAILDHVIEDEKEHYRELGSLIRGHYRPRPALPKSIPRPFSKSSWPSATPAANKPAHGSATPSTASTTASALSSASSPASPAQPPATANTYFSPGSPA